MVTAWQAAALPASTLRAVGEPKPALCLQARYAYKQFRRMATYSGVSDIDKNVQQRCRRLAATCIRARRGALLPSTATSLRRIVRDVLPR